MELLLYIALVLSPSMAQCPSGLRGVIRTQFLVITYALHALVQIQLASNLFAFCERIFWLASFLLLVPLTHPIQLNLHKP
jgi:hypothetical protein